MSYDIQLTRIDPRPTLSIRGRTSMTDLPKTIGEFLKSVWAHLESQSILPASPPFTRYHWTNDLQRLDLEAGFAVPDPTTGAGRIAAGALPGGEVIMTDHFGPYEELPEAGAALDAWLMAHHRAAAGPSWEFYWSDPASEPYASKWRTQVIKPLVPAPRG